MKVQDNEKNRKLSKAEERRLAYFEEICGDLARQGYRRSELTVGIVKANKFAVIFAIPLFALGLVLFFLLNRGRDISSFSSIVFIVSLLVLIVVHELIHGITFAVFTKDHLKSIEFGFMKEYLTPYCTCREPLAKGPYLCGALMPLVILGIIPTIAAFINGSLTLLLTGLVMITAAAGDIMIAINLIKYKSTASDILIFDHPTQAGTVIFER